MEMPCATAALVAINIIAVIKKWRMAVIFRGRGTGSFAGAILKQYKLWEPLFHAHGRFGSYTMIRRVRRDGFVYRLYRIE
jgi:hypothetical protein